MQSWIQNPSILSNSQNKKNRIAILEISSSNPPTLFYFPRNQRLREVLCFTHSAAPVHLITSVFVCSGFFNKTPQSWQLINNRNLFFTLLEVGKSKIRKKGQGSSLEPYFIKKGTDSIHWLVVLLSCPNQLPKVPSFTTITLELEFQYIWYNFRGTWTFRPLQSTLLSF